uniref:Calcineurin-like phosphoesterase domain-containing protein n=1 Tax=Chrysotila carterae TaxID=13221 RepID=A0A7S4F2E1_CHRCT
MPVASTLRLGRARAPVFRACASGLDSDMGTTFYQDSLCDEEEEACELPEDDEFTVAILGDLHLDPRKMEDYYAGREHFKPILEDATARGVNAALVSLGDLGESKSVRPEETAELFAGTSECHELAADFLGSFGVPYEVIGGNHDLEGIDEFSTDEENLEAFLRIHNKPTPQFSRLIADKTMLVGLCSTVFRSAKYTSHEVIIDDEQLRWFEKLLEDHPADEGWKLFVFSHAPPIGSGLRVLQENHVVNGCCWLNHSGGDTTRKFIELVRKHRCVKAWFSGHFHLGQDYEDSITFPTIPREVGPYPNRGSCVFAQTSVMRSGSSRDGRQQSRLLRGNKDGFQICTVQHSGDNAGAVRLDATITYKDTSHEVGVYAHEHAELKAKDNFIKVYSPSAGDECYISYDDEGSLDPTKGQCVDDGTIAWWHMSDGRVLGMYGEWPRSPLSLLLARPRARRIQLVAIFIPLPASVLSLSLFVKTPMRLALAPHLAVSAASSACIHIHNFRNFRTPLAYLLIPTIMHALSIFMLNACMQLLILRSRACLSCMHGSLSRCAHHLHSCHFSSVLSRASFP